jgi:hypothetical protein
MKQVKLEADTLIEALEKIEKWRYQLDDADGSYDNLKVEIIKKIDVYEYQILIEWE